MAVHCIAFYCTCCTAIGSLLHFAVDQNTAVFAWLFLLVKSLQVTAVLAFNTMLYDTVVCHTSVRIRPV